MPCKHSNGPSSYEDDTLPLNLFQNYGGGRHAQFMERLED